MSPVSSRRLVTTGSLTLALALAAPSAAFADPALDRGQAPADAGDARSDRAPGPREQAAPAAGQEQERAEKGRSKDAPAGEQPAKPQGEARPASTGSGSSAGKPANAGSGSSAGKPANAGSGSSAGKPANAGSGSSERAPAAERKQRKRDRGPAKAAPRKDAAAPAKQQPAQQPAHTPVAPQGQGEGQQDADPAGNNGTVKIDGAPFDSGRGNEPHVGCVFQLDFYGFDAGDTASITFTGQSPTRTDVLHSQTTTISDDAAGGGQDRDATLTFSVDDQLSELLEVEPHPKQGWHVKVAVDVTDAPGGAKQKVFWISCDSDTDQAPAGETPTTPGQPKTPDEQTPKTSEDKLPTPQPQTPATPEQDEGAQQETVVPPVDEADAPQQDTEGADSDVPTELTGETEAPATGGTVPPEQPLAVDVATPQAPAAEVSDDAVVAQTAVSGTAVQTAVAGTTVQPATGAAPAERAVVSAGGAATPATLPFTGIQDLAALLAVGVGALGLGGLANRLGRKEALARHAGR